MDLKKNNSIISKWENSGYLIFFSNPDGYPGQSENLMGSKLDQVGSSQFFIFHEDPTSVVLSCKNLLTDEQTVMNLIPPWGDGGWGNYVTNFQF